MSITECLLPHVTQSNCPFTTAVDKLVALDWVEDGSGDDFGQLLHVGWLDVDNVLVGGVSQEEELNAILAWLRSIHLFIIQCLQMVNH